MRACLHLVLGEVVGVQAEVPIAIHVVDVGPHDLQGDVSSLVVGHHVSQLLHMLVTPPVPHTLLHHHTHGCHRIWSYTLFAGINRSVLADASFGQSLKNLTSSAVVMPLDSEAWTRMLACMVTVENNFE